MASQKYSDHKQCIVCQITLTDANWLAYLQKRSLYKCTPCFREYGKQYHKTDLEYNAKQRARSYMRRSAVIHFYGDQCAQCGEDEYSKLTIDHIHGGGTKHRKEMGSNIIDYLYNNTISKDGYQVLCYNCNCSKDVEYKDQQSYRKKQQVIEHYGCVCAECGEARIERLTIDHINNDGAEQRKLLGYKTGSIFYRWLVKKNFPDNLGLQVLCYNCNGSKEYKRRQDKIKPDD